MKHELTVLTGFFSKELQRKSWAWLSVSVIPVLDLETDGYGWPVRQVLTKLQVQ